jgi:hypothetical protein
MGESRKYSLRVQMPAPRGEPVQRQRLRPTLLFPVLSA